ncbi:MAG: DeoR/GlpR transcriptional regulator [Eubacterium sp.]|nr:DeoR/GlpR transcriptional regulator [Eubacterium sp.]
MYIEERRKKILDILNNTGRVDVSQLAEEFGISKETIRRDLRALEETRQLLRTHGGALVQPSSSDYSEYSELPANIRSTLNMDSKKVICRLAASKIQDGDTIFVDNSTTCIYLCQYLPRDKQITILTNSIPFLNECAKISNPKLTVICLGGILKPSNLSLYGTITMQNSMEYFPSKAFISCTGIISSTQITDFGVQEIDVKRSFLRSSKEVFLLADHSKFRPAGQVYLGTLSDIDYLITDKYADFSSLDLSDEFKEKILIAR